ncbi:MAG: 50S ribosomal protein L32e, partial [Candidatus Aenigmarchaeota archaeon]|nr:50S ribosomal protein L32e [Candidatus Aenigmarchaeota archaeon]
MKKLNLRLKTKRKKPGFIRQSGKNLKRLGKKWRRPRGSQSKLRKHKKARGFIPHPGYGSPKTVKGLHPSGFEEVLVHNVKNLEKINPEKQACRIASSVGMKKRLKIMEKTKELKIKVLNPLRIEIKKIEAP